MKIRPKFCPTASQSDLYCRMSPLLGFNRINNVKNIKPSTLLQNVSPIAREPSSIVVHRAVYNSAWGERSLRVVGMEVSMPCPVHMTRQGGIDSTEIYMGSLPPGLGMKRHTTLQIIRTAEFALGFPMCGPPLVVCIIR